MTRDGRTGEGGSRSTNCGSRPTRGIFASHGGLGFVYAGLGNWEKALEEAREAMRLEPKIAVEYNSSHRYASLNRLDEAEAV
jgi:tetratricopeptide (TPR) repeat protein